MLRTTHINLVLLKRCKLQAEKKVVRRPDLEIVARKSCYSTVKAPLRWQPSNRGKQPHELEKVKAGLGIIAVLIAARRDRPSSTVMVHPFE